LQVVLVEAEIEAEGAHIASEIAQRGGRRLRLRRRALRLECDEKDFHERSPVIGEHYTKNKGATTRCDVNAVDAVGDGCYSAGAPSPLVEE
jgi:hypothetical protein